MQKGQTAIKGGLCAVCPWSESLAHLRRARIHVQAMQIRVIISLADTPVDGC